MNLRPFVCSVVLFALGSTLYGEECSAFVLPAPEQINKAGEFMRTPLMQAVRRGATDGWQFFSAGIEKHGLNARMLTVMAEVGMDMSKHFSKTIDELPAGLSWDLVMTVCDRAAAACPYYPGGKLIHLPFDDPPALAVGLPEAEALAVYRRVRDEIRTEIEKLAKCLQNARCGL